jgi:hypothetical protein
MGKLRIYTIILLIFATACSPEGWKLIDRETTKINQSGNLAANLAKDTQIQYALLISEDGLGIVVSKPNFQNIKIINKNGWQLQAPQLPPSANIKNLQKICVFSDNYIEIFQENKKFLLSPFQIYLQNMKFEGEASQNGNFIRKYRKSKEVNFNADSIFINSQKISWESLRKRIDL